MTSIEMLMFHAATDDVHKSTNLFFIRIFFGLKIHFPFRKKVEIMEMFVFFGFKCFDGTF